ASESSSSSPPWATSEAKNANSAGSPARVRSRVTTPRPRTGQRTVMVSMRAGSIGATSGCGGTWMSTNGFITSGASCMRDSPRGGIDQDVGDRGGDRAGVRRAEEGERACRVELEEHVAAVGAHHEIDRGVVEPGAIGELDQAVSERARQLAGLPRRGAVVR